MASICCSPPDSTWARLSARWYSTGNSSKASSRLKVAATPAAARARPTRSPRSRFSRTVIVVKADRPSGTRATPWSRSRLRAGSRVMSVPPTSTRPDRAGTSPAAARSTELLPAPFEPTRAVTRPRTTSSDPPCTARIAP